MDPEVNHSLDLGLYFDLCALRPDHAVEFLTHREPLLSDLVIMELELREDLRQRFGARELTQFERSRWAGCYLRFLHIKNKFECNCMIRVIIISQSQCFPPFMATSTSTQSNNHSLIPKHSNTFLKHLSVTSITLTPLTLATTSAT